MAFLKHYWFGILTGLIIFIGLIMFVLILLSPRQDLQRRGFIPCTEDMAERLIACDRQIGCVMGAIMENSWCDAKVIGRGVKNWLSGKQSAPWSNYIFIPELPADELFDEAAQKEYFQNNPDSLQEMQELKQLNEELENDNSQSDIVDPAEQPE